MERSTGISLSKTSCEPLYKQLFDQIVSRILSRAFPPGYRLPPTRLLATELRTNRNTVVRAYADLEAAGFVASTVGRGTFVALDTVAMVTAAAPSGGGLPWPSLVASSSRLETLRRAQRWSRSAG